MAWTPVWLLPALSLTLLACGNDPEPSVPRGAAGIATTAANTTQSPGERAVLLMEQMAAIMTQHTQSCDNMGVALEGFMAQYGPTIAALKADQKRLPDLERKQLMQRYSGRMKAVVQAAMQHGRKCRDNPRVKAAMSQI